MPSERLFTPRFIGLWSFALVTFFSAFQFLPAIPFRILALGGSKAVAGSFLTVYTLASAFSGPVTGTIADHIGRRRLLIIASVLFIGFSVLYGLITWLPLLLAVAAIHGAIWSGLLASSAAIMTEMIPESRRTEGIAYWGLASTIAVAVAPLVGLLVYKRGWIVLCGELALLSVGMTIAALLIRSEDVPRDTPFPALADVWDWRVIRATLTLTAISFGYGGVTSYTAIYALERHVHPEAIYLSAFATTIIIVRLTTSRFADRVGPRRMLFPALACIPLAFAILPFATTRNAFIASAILFGIGLGIAYPTFVTFILQHTDPERRARTFGSILWAFDTGIGTGSLLIGIIGDRYTLGTAFGCAAVIACFSIPVFLATSRDLTAGAPAR